MTELQIRAKLTQEMMKFPSLRQAAKKWDISPAYLSDIVTGKRGVSDAVARLIGYTRVETKTQHFVKLDNTAKGK